MTPAQLGQLLANVRIAESSLGTAFRFARHVDPGDQLTALLNEVFSQTALIGVILNQRLAHLETVPDDEPT